MLINIVFPEMDFKQVIKTCLDFATNNKGTIQACSERCNPKIGIHSRNTRTEIYVEQADPGVWKAEQTQNAVGEKKNQTEEIVSTEKELLDYISRYWDCEQAETIAPQINIAISPQNLQLNVGSADASVTRVADGPTGLARFEVKVTVVIEQVQ